jgi:hypothetical protein
MTQDRRSIHVVTVLLVLAMSLISDVHACEATASRSSEEFHEFWGHFRTSVLAGDKEGVAALTYFPFKTRGMLDSDPIRLHDRLSFIELFDRLVMQDTGLKRAPEPMRDLIQRTDLPRAKPAKKQVTVRRIGNFVFQRINNEWCFVMAYLDEE